MMMAMMKLAVLVLVCAAVARTSADAPEAASSEQAEENVELEKKLLSTQGTWISIHGRYFSYFSTPKTWAKAESYCRSFGANLASVKNSYENRMLLQMIRTRQGRYTPTWIGGSDAQTNGIWFWSDGSNYQYINWCPNEPNNFHGHQECLQMSFSSRRCWDDAECWIRRPFICVKRRQ